VFVVPVAHRAIARRRYWSRWGTTVARPCRGRRWLSKSVTLFRSPQVMPPPSWS